jgi:outer membrane protein TolC
MGLSATLPVLDRPRLLAALGGETARRAEALALLERTVQTALAEADQGFMRLDAETLRAERLRAAESAAQRAFEAARRRYGAGLDDIDPVLAAERAWREARSQALEGRVSRISRTIDLFKALGGGWSPAAIQTQQGQPT